MVDEGKIHELFSVIFAAQSAIAMHEAIKELLSIGLTEKQVENGLIAGSLQIQIDLGRIHDVDAFCRRLEDGEIIKKSLLPAE